MSKSEDPKINTAILLEQTRDIVYHAIELELKHLKLNIPIIKILTMLSRQKEGATLNDIANWSLRELNTTSTLINKLVDRGLVRKFRKNDDPRAYFSLTEEGEDLYQNKITERSIHMIFEGLSDEENRQLDLLLKKVRDRSRDLLGIDYKPPFLP